MAEVTDRLYAYITRRTHDQKPLVAPEYLSISDNRPAAKRREKDDVLFLISPMTAYRTLHQSREDPNCWELTFFLHSGFSLTLNVTLATTPLPDSDWRYQNVLAKAIWLKKEQYQSVTEQQIQDISQFLRRSNAVGRSSMKLTTHDRYLVNDRDGLAYCALDAQQFKRIVLCQALAVAYSQVMGDCMDRLVPALKERQYDALPDLYESVLFFNASDYFSHPVRRARHELFAAWELIRDHWHLDEMNRELTEQLAGVASLLEEHRDRQATKLRHDEIMRQKQRDKEAEAQRQEALEQQRQAEQAAEERRRDADRAEQRKNRKFNVIMGVTSVIIGIFSILSLVELTPDHFTQAYANWIAPWLP